MKCDITWCHETEGLMRRKVGSPLFKRFGQMTLCRTHVPPWRQDEYEPLDGGARPPDPAPEAEAAPTAPTPEPEKPKARKPHAKKDKVAKEEAPF